MCELLDTCPGKTAPLAHPASYCKTCFFFKLDELKPAGPCHGQKYNGKKDTALLAHLDRVKYMSFGVHKWLFEKALNGDTEALWKLDYGYNLFNEVQNKHHEISDFCA